MLPKSLRWLLIASGLTLVLITAFFFKYLPPPPQPAEQLPPPQVLGTGGVNFKSYKGLNLPWGINSQGNSTYRDWLSSKYDEAVISKAFDHIKNMGVQTVGVWLWFDRMLVKDSTWGTSSYRTQFNPAYQANWESFLRMIKTKDMEVIVTMFPATNGAQGDPYNMEGDIFTAGPTSPKWQNYLQAVKDWAGLYKNSSEFGPAIAAWQAVKEASDRANYKEGIYPFLKDFYQAVKSTGTLQPVGTDNSPYVKLPVTDPANLPWFTEAADYYNLHIYRDEGAIPDTSRLDKPFIIGELGADNKCPGGGFPPDSCSGNETHVANPNADWNLNAVRTFYTSGLSAGAKTVMAWSWTSNPTIAQHNSNGANVFGNAGEWIKNWNPAGGTPPPPVPSPSPTPNPPSAYLSLQSDTTFPQGTQIPVKAMAESSTDSANTFVAKISFPAQLLTVSNIDTTGSFVTNWTEKYFDNAAGTISLVGAVPNPGYKTSGSPALLATIYLTSKASGTANFTFDPASVIYRNSDNANILAQASGSSININPIASPLPTTSPSPSPTPIPTPTPTPTPLPAPLNLTATALSYKQVNLSWQSGSSGTPTYWIIRDNVTIAQTTAESYTDTTVLPSNNYSYQVVATDNNGINSEPSNVATVTTPATPDTTPPTAPANLAAVPISSSQINLSWGPSTDDIGVLTYDIYQNDTLLTSVSGKTLSFGATGLNPATFYQYSIIAKDAAGNSSEISNVAHAITLTEATPTPTPAPIKGDFSRDDVINLLDHSILLSNWGKAKFTPVDTDLNSDGVINAFDFALLKQILIDNNIIRR